MNHRLSILVTTALALLIQCAGAFEDSAPDANDNLPRLIGSLDSEPLAFIAVRDARSLADKYKATTLAQMIADQSFEKGSLALESKLIEMLGVSVRNSWPALEKNFSGPVVLALLPPKAPAAEVVPAVPAKVGDPAALRLVILVAVPVAEVGTVLSQQWPKPMNPGTVIAAAPLKTVGIDEMPTWEKLPGWAATIPWPKGDIILRVHPIKLCEAARGLIKQLLSPIENLGIDVAPLITTIEGSGIDAVTWGLTFKEEQFSEQLFIEINENDSAFKRFVATIREKPGAWNALMAATPGEQDAAIMLQTNPMALGNDLPFVFQALERMLRGKKWSRAEGMKPDAYDPARFKFLYERMQGMFSVVARPALSGDLRMIVASAVKGVDVEVYRGELIPGLEKIDAGFETFGGARKIGGASPLGATFQGRGRFAAPVIGLSPGWAWLCSSSAAYIDLTDSLKNQRMMSDRGKKRPTPPIKDPSGKIKPAPQADPNAPSADAPPDPKVKLPSPDYWKVADAWRAEVNLERVFKIGYAAWLLSSNDGPQIGSYKIPNELVPSPQVFARHLGYLQAAANRQERGMECRSQCIFPGVSLALLGVLQEASEAVTQARKSAIDFTLQAEARAEAEKALAAEKEKKKNAGKDKNKPKTDKPPLRIPIPETPAENK